MAFGKLGALGRGFGHLGSLGGASGSPALLPAPTLSWTSGTGDNTPDLTITFPDVLVVGTIISVQYATNSGFSGASQADHALTSPESLAQEVNLALSSFADGTWYIRAKYAGSAWSNTETKTIAATWVPSSLSGLVFAGDTLDTSFTPDDGSGKVAQFRHIYDATKYLGRTTQANRPSIITNGGVSGNKRLMSFASASNNNLNTAEGANLNTLYTMFNGSDIRTSVVYWCWAAKANSTAVTNRMVVATSDAFTVTSQFGLRQTAGPSRAVSYSDTAGVFATVGDTSPDTSYHVFSVVKNGASLTVKVDGTTIGTATITQSAAMSTIELLIGGTYVSGSRTSQFDGIFGRMIVASAIPSSGDQTSAEQWCQASIS